MKTRTWLWLAAAAALVWLTPHPVIAGACIAARFHDWRDTGCNPSYAGAGSAPSPKMCSDCGMPRWWVSEPYLNLWMSDTPLSYMASSGQELAFQFYYRQRYKLPAPDEMPTCPLVFPVAQVYNQGSYFRSVPGYGMTNTYWGNNWMANIFFWTDNTAATNFQSDGYQALVFQPDGSMNYFYNTNQVTSLGGFPPAYVTNWFSSLRNAQSQMQLRPLSGLPYPTVSPVPVADSNGIYWGDSPTNGFQLAYPDGSKDVFGLCPDGSPILYYSWPVRYALLTQRIDPQGRVTRVGYEFAHFIAPDATSYNAYRVRYVVDSDGRTNAFKYTAPVAQNAWQISEIDDPYSRKVQMRYATNGYLTSIIDAAGLTNSFAYQGTNGIITNLTTPYGNTTFNFYELTSPGEPDGFQQRALYVQEPGGAQQLFYYNHVNPNLPATDIAPQDIPGQSFDDGTSGISGHYPLYYRNTFHWGRRQFAALSGDVQSVIGGSLSNALSSLANTDYAIARARHWLMASNDQISITDALSSERDPSPDAAGLIDGLRTWYNYSGKPSAELLGDDPQVSCIARILPDGTNQYTTYNYYPLSYTNGGAGFVSDTESTVSLPDGTTGLLTNWFAYATNSIDLVSVSNSVGQWTQFGYNAFHQTLTRTNALQQGTVLSWNNGTHNLTNILLPAGKRIGIAYYATSAVPGATSGLISQITIQPEGRSLTFNSYQAGLPASVTDDRGLTMTRTWDGLNRLTGMGFPDGTTVSNVFYRLDRVGSKDRLNHWTYFGFDGLRHLTSVTNANNAVTTYSWCGCGSLNSVLDALNQLTSYSYDNQGNRTGVIFPDTSSLTYQFDLAQRMAALTDGDGRTLQIGYNNQGLRTSVTGANETWRQTVYDAVNRPIIVTDQNQVTVTNTFDAINELTKRTWQDGISEGYGYTAAGLIAYTNLDGKVTRYLLDAAGRRIAETNANLEVTRQTFDSLDNVIALIDGLNHQTTWKYNEYGWETNKTDALNRVAFRRAYNANGWETNRWTPEKGNTGYTYDNVGNETAILYPQSTILFAYDLLNQMTNMVDRVGTHKFAWTPTGRLASEDGPWANDTVSRDYSQGLRTQLTITQPSGTNWTQTYARDAAWRLTNTATMAGGFIYNYLSSVLDSPSSINLPNGATITNTFDSLARLTSTALNDHWGHSLDGYTYELDPLGLRTNILRDIGLTTSTVNIGYDSINQLTSWTAKENDGTPRLQEQNSWQYDAANNLHTRSNGGFTQTFNVDAANQLSSIARAGNLTLSGATLSPALSVTVNGLAAQVYADQTFARTNLPLNNGNNTFTNFATYSYGFKATNIFTANLPANVAVLYDNNGNLTNDGVRSYGFDAENQLTNVYVPGQWKSEYVYDGLNRRRIYKDYTWTNNAWLKTSETRIICDGYLSIQERDANNNVLVTYTRGLDMSQSLSGAGGIGGLLARTDTSGSVYYHADGGGNITGLMDGSENMVGRYLYGPFGKLLGQWGKMAPANRMQFSSEWTHPSGIVFYPRRVYLPELGIFASEDPIQERGGKNLHRAMKNNPLRWIDPKGLFGVSDPYMLPSQDGSQVNNVPYMKVTFPHGINCPPKITNNDSPEELAMMMIAAGSAAAILAGAETLEAAEAAKAARDAEKAAEEAVKAAEFARLLQARNAAQNAVRAWEQSLSRSEDTLEQAMQFVNRAEQIGKNSQAYKDALQALRSARSAERIAIDNQVAAKSAWETANKAVVNFIW